MARLLLVRHTAVSPRCAGRCYGRTDVALSAAGLAEARTVATAVAEEGFDAVFASPARRASILALRIGARLGRPVRIEPRLAERHFGAWEGRSWDQIWAAEGAPDSYRPGGGEPTGELAARVLAWFRGLAPGAAFVAVAHGGPIAALAGSLLEEPPRRWLRYVPAPGCGLRLEADGSGWRVTPWRPVAVAGDALG